MKTHSTKTEIKTDDILRDNGFKVTPSRVAILSLFSEKCNPLSADQIFEKLSPDVDLVTVYRTMASFDEKGIVRRVNLHKDAAFYELNSDHHHHHIICTNCGKIEKFDKCVADSLVKTAASHSANFAEIKGHSLEFFGICKACAKK
jgi:Fur family ferric uptake transcriptional regulator